LAHAFKVWLKHTKSLFKGKQRITFMPEDDA